MIKIQSNRQSNHDVSRKFRKRKLSNAEYLNFDTAYSDNCYGSMQFSFDDNGNESYYDVILENPQLRRFKDNHFMHSVNYQCKSSNKINENSFEITEKNDNHPALSKSNKDFDNGIGMNKVPGFHVVDFNQPINHRFPDSLKIDDPTEVKKYEKLRNEQCPIIDSQVKMNSIRQRNYDAATSPIKGWQRVGDKYHGDTDTFMSPIKHNLCVLKPKSSDSNMRTQAWILNTSESFYYDNIILLLSRFRDQYVNGSEEHENRISKALRDNYTKITSETTQFWTNAVKLGEGSFGIVYRVTDSRTNEIYAVKYVKPNQKLMREKQTKHLLDFLRERNILVRAYNNPFIMQFLSSFKLPDIGGLFLVFEYCISDLAHFIRKLSKYRKSGSVFTRIHQRFTKSKKQSPYKRGYDALSKKIGRDVQELIIVYAFELFCGLDYMAKCDIVHRDIKPSNIMISKEMHLKIGDFGLFLDRYYITSEPNMRIIEDIMKLNVDENLYENSIHGTEIFMDPESVLYNAPQDFMADAFAVALVILEMMMLGDLFFFDLLFDHKYEQWTKTQDLHELRLKLTKQDSIFKEHVEDKTAGLFDDERMQQLARMIAPLFRPRKLRKTNYLSKKRSRRYCAEFDSVYVDIDSVQKVLPFSEMNITLQNVFMYNFEIKKFLGVDENETGRTFKELFKRKRLTKEKGGGNVKRLFIEPGINMRLGY